MKAIHSRSLIPAVLLVLAAASSVHAGPGVDFWMRKRVFSQAKPAAAAPVVDQSVSTSAPKTVEVTRIDHSYRGVPHQVVVQVPAPATAPTAIASSEKPVENTTAPTHSSSASSAVIH